MVDARFTVVGGVGALRPAARRAAACACHLGVPVDRYDDVELAVHEALANALEHGHGGDGDRPIRVQIDVEVARDGERGVVVRVTDEAVGADRPTPGDPGRGRGRALVRRLSDGVAERSTSAGTTVTMRWSAAARPEMATWHDGPSASSRGR